jgi:hypothetical protein
VPLQYDPVFGITDHDHTVVQVQVYSTELHVGPRQSKALLQLDSTRGRLAWRPGPAT